MYGPDDTTFADDGQTLQRDLSCAGCGYNLRGLKRTGVCPECGKPIAETIKRVGPEDIPDLGDEFSGLSWTYLGMSVLLLVCAIPIGLDAGWAGLIIVTALAGYRLFTLWRIDRVLTLRQQVNAGSVRWLFGLTTVELASGVILLGIFSLPGPAGGGGLVYFGIIAFFATIWIAAMLLGLAIAGRAVGYLREQLHIEGSATLLNAQVTLAVVAGWMVICGASLALISTAAAVDTFGVLSFVVAALCILASSVLLFVALQHLAQSLHEALIDERASQIRAHRIALPGRGVIEVDPDGRVQGGSTSAEPEGGDDEPPPIPLVGDDGGEAHPSKPGMVRDARGGTQGPDTDDPMAHIEERR